MMKKGVKTKDQGALALAAFLNLSSQSFVKAGMRSETRL